MAFRSEVHKTLSLLLARDGVPPACIYNNTREMIQGKVHQKLKDAAFHLKQLKPYTIWSNAAEREIKELKKGGGHRLLRFRAPKHLWDDCLEFEAYIRSNTAHEIYKLDGEVPKRKQGHFLTDQQITVQVRPVTCKTTAGWQLCC